MESNVDGKRSQKRSKRDIRSRKNTPEEKVNQLKAWKKKRRERQRTAAGRVQKANAEAHEDSNEQGKPRSSSQKRISLSKDARKPERVSKQSKAKVISRGAMMLSMARGLTSSVVAIPPSGRSIPKCNREVRTGKQATNQSKIELRELNPAYLEDLSVEAVGSGSYGQCFRARYRSIEVLVKKMTHSNTTEDKERAKRNVIHEAKVLLDLGDHARLPLFFGMITKSEPLCLVTQFHGVDGQSVTLHRAANTDQLTALDCIEIFQEICYGLRHVHSRGYLHNDIKANNVVLERPSTSGKYNPVLIDFGKSTKAAAVSSSQKGKKRSTPSQAKSYLAPEVLKERLYSVASDIYSMGRMLKAVASMVGFYQKVRPLVKEATSDTPSSRPQLNDFIQKLNAIEV